MIKSKHAGLPQKDTNASQKVKLFLKRKKKKKKKKKRPKTTKHYAAKYQRSIIASLNRKP